MEYVKETTMSDYHNLFLKRDEFHNDYPLAPEKLESSCQVFIVILQINMTQKKVVL